DVTAETGLARSGYCLGAAVGDYDNDGWDDLVVTYQGGIALYHNEPDGNGGRHFVDVTEKAKLDTNPHLATSCAWGDIDGDGLLDIYVANDLKPAYLFHNQGNGRFVEKAVLSGCGLDMSGSEVAGMGIDAGDLDGSGRPSLFVTNFQNRPNMLFLNRGGMR